MELNQYNLVLLPLLLSQVPGPTGEGSAVTNASSEDTPAPVQGVDQAGQEENQRKGKDKAEDCPWLLRSRGILVPWRTLSPTGNGAIWKSSQYLCTLALRRGTGGALCLEVGVGATGMAPNKGPKRQIKAL